MKISACMIVKNEEKNIKKCIDSYCDIVDEVIVVDTGSIDNTVKIAESLGASVYFYEWENDFSKAKNYALTKAKGDWIIFLDADEYFDKLKAQKIPNIIRKYEKKGNEIIACKMVNIDEKTGENLADFVQARIFKNTRSIYYISPIHERLHSEGKNANGVYIEENELIIYHTGYSRELMISKAKRNLDLLLVELAKPEVEPSIFQFLSDTYLTLEDYDKSIEFAKKFLENRIKLEGLNNKVYQNLISAMVERKYPWEEVYKVIFDAIAEFPDHPMFQLYLARAHHFTKRYEKALESYLETIELQNKYNGTDINFVSGKIHEIETHIASIYKDKNKEDCAIDYYLKALGRKKDYLPALQGLIKLIERVDPIEVIPTLNGLYDRNDKEQITILVEELTKQRSGRLLAYYVTHLSKQFNHQDFSMVMMFLTNSKYEEAYRHFYEAYLINYDNSYAKLTIVAAYLNNDDEALSLFKSQVKPSYKRIIEALILESDNVVLYPEDLKDLLDILSEMIKLQKVDYIDSLIKLKDRFSDEIFGFETAIGNMLRDEGYYDEAVELFKEVIKRYKSSEPLKKELKSLYFVIGYCYYKNRNIRQALEYFEKALKYGYLENDIRDFVVWTIDQTEEVEIKGYAQKLVDQFDETKSKNAE